RRRGAARTAVAILLRWPRLLPGSHSTATPPPFPPSPVTPPDTAASIPRAIKSLTSGSPTSRPGASFRRPEWEPRPPHPDPSCAAEVASLAAFALSNRPCLPLLHASRSPHLSCPDAVARRSLAPTAVTRPRSAPAPVHQSARPPPVSTAQSTPPSAAQLARSQPVTS